MAAATDGTRARPKYGRGGSEDRRATGKVALLAPRGSRRGADWDPKAPNSLNCAGSALGTHWACAGLELSAEWGLSFLARLTALAVGERREEEREAVAAARKDACAELSAPPDPNSSPTCILHPLTLIS